MKKISKLVLLILLVFTLFGCTNEVEKYAYVSIDYNLKLEFILDSKNKVVAYNGKDDITKTILLNEEIRNKKIDDVIKQLFKLSSNTGFLLPSSIGNSQIIVSVGGSFDKEKLHILEMKITNMCENSLRDAYVTGTVKIENLKTRVFFEEEISKTKYYLKDKVTSLSIDDLMMQMKEIINDNNEYLNTNFVKEANFMRNNDILLKYYQEASKLTSSNETLNTYISNYEKNLNDYYREDIDFLTNDYNRMQEELRAIEKDYIYYRYSVALRKYLDNNDNDVSNKYNDIQNQYNDAIEKVKVLQNDYEQLLSSHKDELMILSLRIEKLLDELFTKEEINNLKNGIIYNNSDNEYKTKLNTLITNEKLKQFETGSLNYKEELKDLIKKARLMK